MFAVRAHMLAALLLLLRLEKQLVRAGDAPQHTLLRNTSCIRIPAPGFDHALRGAPPRAARGGGRALRNAPPRVARSGDRALRGCCGCGSCCGCCSTYPQLREAAARLREAAGRRRSQRALSELSESSQSAPAELSESSARALGGSGRRPGGAARPLRGSPRLPRGGGSGSRPGAPLGAQMAQKCTFSLK